MRKIIIGIAALFSLITTNGLAASLTGTSKSDVSIPCFNGGFGFGLAGYYLKPLDTLSDSDQKSQDQSSSSDLGNLKSKFEIS